MEIRTSKKVCDNCDEVLFDEEGKNRKSFISIKGSVCLNGWLPNQERYSYLYMTQRANELHEFCDIDCLKKWVEKKRKMVIEALHKSYLDRVNNAASDEKVELEEFGITKQDLKLI